MARPQKNGLDYFSFDVDFFSDRKVKRLRSRFGTKGITVYIYLLCEIYHAGYQIDYNEDLVLDISAELNLSENATTEIIEFLLSRGLFDKTLAKSDKVLTSKSVQSRYQEAKKGLKREIEIESRTWLLEPEKTCTFIRVRPPDCFSEKKQNNSEKNQNNSWNYTTKKRKEKESKGKKSNSVSDSDAAFPPSLVEVQTYTAGIADRETAVQIADKFYSYYQGTGWKTKNGAPITDWKGALRHWINTEKEKTSRKKEVPKSDNAAAYQSFIYNLDE